MLMQTRAGRKQWYQIVQALIKYEVTEMRKIEKYCTFLDYKVHRA